MKKTIILNFPVNLNFNNEFCNSRCQFYSRAIFLEEELWLKPKCTLFNSILKMIKEKNKNKIKFSICRCKACLNLDFSNKKIEKKFMLEI